MSSQISASTPPKSGGFKPSVCSTPATSSMHVSGAKVQRLESGECMTPEQAEKICEELSKEYKDFLTDATQKFKQLSAQHKAEVEKLKMARAERDALVAEIKAKDLLQAKKQEELKQKDKQIAATRETLIGEMNNVSVLKQTLGAEKIELESPIAGEVMKKLKEVLFLLGNEQETTKESETQKTQKDIPVTIELGKEVLQITERVYKENKALVKMFGNPSEKLFGWIGDVYYPYPPREFRNNQLMIRDKARDRNEVPGRPTVVSIVPLTTNGSCISVREYKAVYEVGLRAVAEFLKVMGSTKQKSKDRLDMEVNSMLSAQENSEFQRLVDTVIRGFIPPKLRGFFTNPQAKEEYAKVTRDGITALLAAIFNKGTEKLSLDSDKKISLKTSFTKQVLTTMANKCQNHKLRDLCSEAVNRVNQEVGIVLLVKGTRKLMTLAAKKATRGIVHDHHILAALSEAYKPKETVPTVHQEEEGNGTLEDEGNARKRRKPTRQRNEVVQEKKGKGPTAGETSNGTRGRTTRGGTSARGRGGRNGGPRNGKGRNKNAGNPEEQGDEEEEDQKQKKSPSKIGKTKKPKKTAPLQKKTAPLQKKMAPLQKKTQKPTNQKHWQDDEDREMGEDDVRENRFVSFFNSDDEEGVDSEEEGREAKRDSEDETLVDEIVELQAKPKSARLAARKAKGKEVAPGRIVPWEGSKIRGDHIRTTMKK